MKINDIPSQYVTNEQRDSWVTYTPKVGFELSLYGDVIDAYDINNAGDVFFYMSVGGTVEYQPNVDIEGLHLSMVERTLVF